MFGWEDCHLHSFETASTINEDKYVLDVCEPGQEQDSNLINRGGWFYKSKRDWFLIQSLSVNSHMEAVVHSNWNIILE